MTYDDVRRFALGLPGVEEYSCYGTPGLRVGKKFLTRLREDDVIVLRADFDEREMLMAAEPQTFFITDHYRAYPSVLARLSLVHPGTVQRLLTQHWRQVAPKRVVKAFDDQGSGA